ncbi:MAG: hypothetical protein IJP30_00425 [Clostridia bacterium]|nr:hypothetical protein [Clostridia bacterium]
MSERFRSDILFFFDKHIDALPIYEQLEKQIVSLIPETKIKVSKTQISFSLTYGYVFVSFDPCKKAAERPPIWLTVTFGLGYRKTSSRIAVATEPYPNRWTHHIMISSVEDIDDELLGWIREAASFAAQKRR